MAMTVEVAVIVTVFVIGVMAVFMALRTVLRRGRQFVAMLMRVAWGMSVPGGSGSGGLGTGGHRFHFTRVSGDA